MKLITKDLYCYDVEWVPCLRTGRLLTKLPDAATDQEVLEAMWKRARATPEKPRPFLKLAISRIISISALHRHVNDDGSVTFALRSFPDTANPEVPEGDIINSFLAEVAKNQAQMIGFNCAHSDLPILVQRGIALGCRFPHFGERADNLADGVDCFSAISEAHLDLATAFTGGGGFGSAVMPSLDEMAAASLIPGKMDHSGSDVLEMWQGGQYADITGYNETDVCTTYLLWLRTAFSNGWLTAEQRNAELSEFNQLLRMLAPSRPHLSRFLEEWRARRRLAECAGRTPMAPLPTSLRIVAEWAPPADEGTSAMPSRCEFLVKASELNRDEHPKVWRHLVPNGANRYLLCSLGYDQEGQLMPGRDAQRRPLLLKVATRDIAGIMDAVARAFTPAVDEWPSPEAA